ncbi:MAG: MerR family transcriptional regulator [Candidatus Accumulibacter sp. UW20]
MTTRPAMNISAVERDTGLGKDTLRVWERRYGFPQPDRDGNGERLYPADQVERLRLMKRLIDQGHRPGRLFGASAEDLAKLCRARAPFGETGTQPGDGLVAQSIRLIKSHEVPALQQTLNQAMMRLGLQRFIIDIVAPLNHAVGEAWMNGDFQVFEEHLYTEQIKSLLRQALGNLPTSASRPRILLTTIPDERHLLGLLMAEALLALNGADCISLGTQTPIADIEMAASAHQVDIVALSFSAAFPARPLAVLVSQVRQLLPDTVELWLGGSGAERVAAQAGIVVLPSLQGALDALAAWRENRQENGWSD